MPRPDSRRRAWWPALCLLALSACAVQRASVELPELPTWELRQAVLGAASDWQFKGRIAVKAGDEGFNGKFDWTQTGDRFSASVGGPLGMGTVRIEGDGRTVVLTDKDGVETVMTDAETELYYRYGWTIPVASLRYWALGIPDPSVDATTEIDGGRLVHLEQGNWTVAISRYRGERGTADAASADGEQSGYPGPNGDRPVDIFRAERV